MAYMDRYLKNKTQYKKNSNPEPQISLISAESPGSETQLNSPNSELYLNSKH